MMSAHGQFLEHQNKWTHYGKPINIASQNRFCFHSISTKCWEIASSGSCYISWMWNNLKLPMSYIVNIFHTPGNFSALSWERMKTKPVLRSYMNRLSIMGSFVLMLQELPVFCHHEYEKTLIPLFFGSHCMRPQFAKIKIAKISKININASTVTKWITSSCCKHLQNSVICLN